LFLAGDGEGVGGDLRVHGLEAWPNRGGRRQPLLGFGARRPV
jgi:hypothetical protein